MLGDRLLRGPHLLAALWLAAGCSSSHSNAPSSPSPGDMAVPPEAAPPPDMANPAGPWPTGELTVYGAAQGLNARIIDATPDEGQNIWAASRDTLYVLRPGSTQFVAFTANDGLHIGPFTDPDGNSNTTFITAIAGGAANQVFVGYYGYESVHPFTDSDDQKQLGNADRVDVGGDGKLTITRYLFRCDYEFANGCWENRSPRRMLYAHQGIAAGHLFIGFNHGVSHVYNDVFGDHVHPEVWYPQGVEKIGEFYGLALTADGDLWVGGRYGVGLQTWNPQPHKTWVDSKFKVAFTTNTDDHLIGFERGPWVPQDYREDNRGAAVAPDGTLWLARLTTGLASWDTKHGVRFWPQAPSGLFDVAADPDGTLWLADTDGKVWRFDPASGKLAEWPGVGAVTRLYLDTTVTPRAIYLASYNGVAVIRAK